MELTKSDYLSIQILLTFPNSGRYRNWKYRIVQPKKGKIYQLLFVQPLILFVAPTFFYQTIPSFLKRQIMWFFSVPNRKYESEGDASSDPNIGAIDHLISLYFFSFNFL